MRKTITKVQTVIGIDSDVERSGVAVLETDTRRLEVSTLTFPDLLDYLMWARRRSEVTGHPIQDSDNLEYIGTFQIYGGRLVFHAFVQR